MSGSHVLSAAMALACSLGALAAYDRLVVRPGQRLAVVDVGEVYRQREAEFTRALTEGSGTPGPAADEARQRALALAQQFARRLPVALQELSQDCSCLVLLKSAVAGVPAQAQDMTAQLRAKLMQP